MNFTILIYYQETQIRWYGVVVITSALHAAGRGFEFSIEKKERKEKETPLPVKRRKIF